MHGLQGVSELAGASLISGVWQGLILAAAVGICLRLASRTTAALRFAVWMAAFFTVALLPLIEHLYLKGVAAPAGGAILRLDMRWSFAIAVIWALLSTLRAIDLIAHAFRLRSLQRRSTPVDDGPELLLAIGFRKARLCTSNEIDRPSVIGFFSPRILIPAWLFEQLSHDELRQIVIHELEHLRRGDDWMNLLQKLSLVLFPLNPVLMWIERRLCFERELACDDGVLRQTPTPHAYASCLTNLAERGLNHRRRISLALGALERQSELGRRVHRILRSQRALTPLQGRALGVAIAFGLLSGAVGLARCPQVVSFAATPYATQASSGPVTRVDALSDAYLPVRAQNARFGETSAPRMTLLKVSVPSASSARAKGRSTAAKRPNHMRSVTTKYRSQAVPPRQSWVSLTSWSVEDHPSAPEPQLEARPILIPYAAVRVDGGWLIFQL